MVENRTDRLRFTLLGVNLASILLFFYSSILRLEYRTSELNLSYLNYGIAK